MSTLRGSAMEYLVARVEGFVELDEAAGVPRGVQYQAGAYFLPASAAQRGTPTLMGHPLHCVSVEDDACMYVGISRLQLFALRTGSEGCSLQGEPGTGCWVRVYSES